MDRLAAEAAMTETVARVRATTDDQGPSTGRRGPVRIAIVGAGLRGREAYGGWILAHPDQTVIVAVADPVRQRRDALADRAGISPGARFDDWRRLIEQANGLGLDAVIVATPDRQHVEPAIATVRLGLPVLLEKPAASTREDLETLVRSLGAHADLVTVGHVLRFTPFWQSVRAVVASGAIGRLMTIRLEENIAFWHFAHSYVRGQWARSAASSPMILAKTCHDLDVIGWLAGQRPVSVASIGSLGYFTADNAPQGAPERCLDGCPAADVCPFFAPRYYVERLRNVEDWHVGLLGDDASPEARLRALATGPYGRCVFRSDNDVVDHQQTIIEFPDGLTAALSTSAFTGQITRTVRLTGTSGELAGHMESGEVRVDLFSPTAVWPAIPFAGDVQVTTSGLMGHPTVTYRAAPPGGDGLDAGHSGGDDGLMEAFVRSVREGRSRAGSGASLANALDSHWLALAAEEARVERRTIRLDPTAPDLAPS